MPETLPAALGRRLNSNFGHLGQQGKLCGVPSQGFELANGYITGGLRGILIGNHLLFDCSRASPSEADLAVKGWRPRASLTDVSYGSVPARPVPRLVNGISAVRERLAEF